MDGFDTMAMPYNLTGSLSLGALQGTDYLDAMSSLEMPGHGSNFDTETFVRCVIITSKWEEWSFDSARHMGPQTRTSC